MCRSSGRLIYDGDESEFRREWARNVHGPRKLDESVHRVMDNIRLDFAVRAQIVCGWFRRAAEALIPRADDDLFARIADLGVNEIFFCTIGRTQVSEILVVMLRIRVVLCFVVWRDLQHDMGRTVPAVR